MTLFSSILSAHLYSGSPSLEASYLSAVSNQQSSTLQGSVEIQPEGAAGYEYGITH